MSVSVHGHVHRGPLALDLALDLPSGLTTITGPNGVGKTTLLRLIAGLEALNHGRLTINDTVVDEPAVGHFVPTHRRSVAVSFQDLRLFPHLTSIDNVAFPLRRMGYRTVTARRRAHAVLEQVGAGEIANDKPDKLSGGQAQRVALARSMAGQPEVLLLDEPLAAIDADSRQTLRALLTQTDLAPTVLWVSHDPQDGEQSASRILVGHHRISHTRTP